MNRNFISINIMNEIQKRNKLISEDGYLSIIFVYLHEHHLKNKHLTA